MNGLLYKFVLTLLTLSIISGCSELGITGGPDIDTLIEQAEQARAEADALGFEWSVTAPLLAKAHETLKSGDEQAAILLFEEAKKQSLLAIEQARYAEQNWEMLIPKVKK